MSLQVAAVHAGRGLEAHLDLAPGRVLALIGPNGAGKSSLLSVIAGLLELDAGTVSLAGRDLGRLPAHRRRVALMTQAPTLFPRMSVLDNVAFGPRCAGAARAASRTTARHWLDALSAGELARRRTSELSGGQAQRIALARALAAQPEVLLLDEPLSALDVAAAADLRHVLRDSLAGRTAVIATHDVLDVALLSDDTAVMIGGRIAETGATERIMSRPGTPFAAGFFGWNLRTGIARGGDELVLPDGSVIIGNPESPLADGEPGLALFRPDAVAVHLAPPQGSPRNVFAGPVEQLQPQGHLVRVRAAGLMADLTARSVAELGLGPGVAVHLAVKAVEVTLSRA